MKFSVLFVACFVSMSLQAAPYVGALPTGLPNHFGIGCDDKAEGVDYWKNGQGTTCWDYSYSYLTYGGGSWEFWSGGSYNFANAEIDYWAARGQQQVFTWYYHNGNMADMNNTTVMNDFYVDLGNLFQRIQANANVTAARKVIVHFEPDLLGYWRLSSGGAGNYNDAGKVLVGSRTAPPAWGGPAWNTTNYPDTIRGWNKAIYDMRNFYAPTKVLLAHHYTHWASGADIMVSPGSAGTVGTATTDFANYILNIENGNKFDLFFADPADRDADWWRRETGNNTRWAAPSYNDADFSQRSWGTEAYIANEMANKLSRWGFMWQIPVGNTYFRTVNNSDGKFRDNRVQGYLPSTSANGATGNPGDAISASSSTTGPGFWANHGIMGVLFGSGAYNWTPGGLGNDLCHQRNYMNDGITNPGADNFAGGPAYNVWGTRNSTFSDDDGGYLRLAAAQYCVVGKFPLPGGATATPTPTTCVCSPTVTVTPTATPADCPVVLNACDTLTDNGTWTGANATRVVSSFPGSSGNAMRVNVTTVPVGGYNAMIANLNAFTPANLTQFVRLTVDVFVPTTGGPWTAGSWHNLALKGTHSTGTGPYQYEVNMSAAAAAELPIDSGGTAVAGGMVYNLSYPLTFPGGADMTMASAAQVDQIFFVLNLDPAGDAAGYFMLDNIVLHTDANCPPPSPTPTATRTRTNTPSPSFTRTASPSATQSPTQTSTASPSASASQSPTRTISTTFSSTATPSRSRTATPSFSATNTMPAATFSSTQTPTATRSATPSFSSTQTPSATRSATPSFSYTRTISPTYSASVTPTGTRTATQTATEIDTPLPGSTFTSTSTISATRTRTATATMTATVSGSSTHTVQVPSATSSATPTYSRTATSSATPTYSRTATPSASSTAQGTATPTVTEIDTPPPGSTFTSTHTVSPTSSATAIVPSATETFTVTPTNSSTSTPSATATPTEIDTPTPSATPLSPLTATETSTPAASASATPVASASPTVTVTFSSTVVPVSSPSPALSERIYDGDAVSTWNPGTQNNTFINDSGGNLTAGGAVSAWAPWSGNGHLDFIATYARQAGDFDYLEFWVWTADAQIPLLNVHLATGTGSVVLGPSSLASLQTTWNSGWNRVLVPLGALVGVLAQVHMVGSGPGVDFRIDDVWLKKGPLPTATVLSTAVPMGNGPNEIEQHVALPSPWDGVSPGFVMAKLAGACDEVTLKVYSRSMVCIGTSKLGAQTGGWVKVPFPAELTSVGANGTYFYVVSSQRGGQANIKKAVGKLAVLR